MPTAEKTRTDRPYLSLSQAARRLGLDPSQLSRAAKQHSLYQPAVRGLPLGNGNPLGTRIVRYHVDQVRTIERVLLGVIDLETGWLEWQIKRRELTTEKGES